MFTGIVEELGEVAGIEHYADSARLAIQGSVDDASPGDSIAVNGVCLTVVNVMAGSFTADVMRETLDRSSLGSLTPGAPVNLERSVRLADRLGGHLVQGHVDATARIISRSPGERWDIVRISLPDEISRYVVEKGSIAVDGVSLTVSALSDSANDDSANDDSANDDSANDDSANDDNANDDSAYEQWFEVSLIPETLKRTTLGGRQPGDAVNLEVDVIAKYVERLVRR